MPKTLPNIVYTSDDTKITPILDAYNSMYCIPYNKPESYFSNIDSYTAFIKGCETLVRNNDRYSQYINYLKKEVKLDHCQVLKNVTDEDADIEMHHGPVFTLFDYCAIILEYFQFKKWKITTPRVADLVLTEHENNRVQIVMLSSTIHEKVHAREIFISMNQAYGNLNAFIKKYEPVISSEYRTKLNRYIDRCKMMDSDDYGVLDLSNRVYNLKKE